MKKQKRGDWLDRVFLNKWRPYGWIVLIGTILYLQIFSFDFIGFDDKLLIVDNQQFLSKFSNIIHAFTQEVFHVPLHRGSKTFYRPILTISFMIDAQIGGTSPFVCHLTNTIIHCLASCLLFLFLTKVGYKKELALFFALIFTVHPVLTQAVAWIPGRNDSLLTVFILSAFICFINFSEKKEWKYYLWHLIFFALALFTKETAIIFLPLSILFLYLVLKNEFIASKGKDVFNIKALSIGWFFVIALWFFLRQSVVENPNITFSFMIKSMLLNSPAVVQYMGKILLPFNLSVFPVMKDTSIIYGISTLIFLIIACYFSRNKRYNFIVFGSSWFILFLLPVLIRPNPGIIADFSEHRVYLPLIGFIIIILETDLIRNLGNNRKILLNIFGLVILAFFIMTFNHIRNFRDGLSFWKNAARTSPSLALAHVNLGAKYDSIGMAQEAVSEYKKAMSLNPREPMAHNNLAIIYAKQKMYEKAEDEFEKELEYNPDYDDAYFNFGYMCYSRGQFDKAESLWKKAIEKNPDHIKAHEFLAILYYNQRKISDAIYYVEELKKRGVKIRPELLRLLQVK